MERLQLGPDDDKILKGNPNLAIPVSVGARMFLHGQHDSH